MACNCGPDRPVRRVLISVVMRVLERAGIRDMRRVPQVGDIVDGAERELLAVLPKAEE